MKSNNFEAQHRARVANRQLRAWFLTISTALCCVVSVCAARAQLVYQLFYSFPATGFGYPQAGLIEGTDGSFYGTTAGTSGSYGFLGAINRITPGPSVI